MTPEQAKEILTLASEKVPFGIYAVRKGIDYYELKNDSFTSRTQLKQARNEYRKRGLKVLCNGLK